MAHYKYSRYDYHKLMNVPCIDVALALGMEINEKQSNAKVYKIEGEQGLCIFRDGSNNWYKFSDGRGGFPIDLVKEKLGCDNEQALDFIARSVIGGITEQSQLPKRRTATPSETNTERKNFIVPEHSIQPKRVMAYLIKTRGIDPEIVKAMIQQHKIAEDDEHHNCLFFGKDSAGNIRSCSLRGTTPAPFRGEISGGDKQYTFAMEGKSNILRLFESPIDAMSHATFSKLLGRDWTTDHRLSVNGSGIYDCIKRYVADHPNITSVCFSYDNDEAGRKGAQSSIAKLKEDFPERNLDIRIFCPMHGSKDWNEDLQLFRANEQSGMNAATFLGFRPPPNEEQHSDEDEELEP